MSRRERHIRAMEPGLGTLGRHLENTDAAHRYDDLLAYLDENEPAVAKAVRYGLKPSGDKIVQSVHYRSDGRQYGSVYQQTYVVDSPPKLCSWGDCCAAERSTSTDQDNKTNGEAMSELGYTVVAIRPSRQDAEVSEVASVGSIWPTLEPCENHLAWCELTAKENPDKYGDVKYAIARLTSEPLHNETYLENRDG